ncbi:MAG: primosomal protein N' [Proteobacteria bacterium]|nr:primosomal protein N' [Pseudomonadota bacterium]
MPGKETVLRRKVHFFGHLVKSFSPLTKERVDASFSSRMKGIECEGKRFAEVAVGLPVAKTFYYEIPSDLGEALRLGSRVLVPFRGRKVTGYAIAFPVELADYPRSDVPKTISDILDERPLFDNRMLTFYRWISDYYLYPLGQVIKGGLPPGINLESQQLLSTTPRGRALLESNELTQGELTILRVIADHGEIPLEKGTKRFPHWRIYSLKKAGLIQIKQGLKDVHVKPKREKVVKYREEMPMEDEHLSPKGKEVLAFIREMGEISHASLCGKFKGAARIVKRLTERGLISVETRGIYRDPLSDLISGEDVRPKLTPKQVKALETIVEGIDSLRFSPFLLYGITGSGKTEIYLRAIERVIEGGRQAIVLVPEISLTPQLIGQFLERFSGRVATLHSGLSRGERYDEWRRIREEKVDIVIGARSAIFAPFERLGMIIVDEEHETSYKQEEKLRYNARDVAAVRAKLCNAVLILGSATPSLEAYHNAVAEKFRLLKLDERIEGRPLPSVEIVDMRREEGKGVVLSENLRKALGENLAIGRQSLLFLNRRGFASFIQCPDCGFVFKCPNCSVSLTHHFRGKKLVCHYCNYAIMVPDLCPDCQGSRIRSFGIGTERVEEEIRKMFPRATVDRMDRDTTRRKRSHHRILKRVKSGETDILVGTQMIAKGHDFPNVTLVGVICADLSLNFPDFRSSERTFQLLTQVAGRAGRGMNPGKVIIQTFNPGHYSIQMARDQDFTKFCREELRFRKELGYPPFSRLINIRIEATSQNRAVKSSEEMGEWGRKLLKKRFYGTGIEILGPSPAPLVKIKGKYRYQMLIKGTRVKPLHRFVEELVGETKKRWPVRGIGLTIDVDPISVM